MPATEMGRKLDLSKLSDEEAKHVWEVVQRDFDLRRKEEDRLGELKSKIEREDTKRELLGSQSSLTESYCIRCLQPFKFLVNIKRQCLDCRLYVCKSCSRFSKRDQGWVCDPCHMARVLKIGTLEWYHENVRARFKRFGSAKVMRSLFKRLSKEHICSQSDPGEPREYDTQSMPEVHTDGYEETSLDASDSGHLQGMKKAKRRLTVDPVDFILASDYSSNCRAQQDQISHQASGAHDGGLREAMLAEADMEAVFQQIVQEQQQRLEMTPQHDEMGFLETRTIPSRSMSRLSYSSGGSGSVGGPRGCSSYLPSLDDSEAEEDHCQRYPGCRAHPGPCSHTSEESLNSTSTAPQLSDLNRRMSAIETLLNRLEQKVTSTNKDSRTPTPQGPSPRPPQWEEVDLEEQQLRQKLHQLTDNISDHSLTSDEDECDRPSSSQGVPSWWSPQGDRRPSRIPTRPTSRTSISSSRLEEELPLQWDSLKGDSVSESPERREPSTASFRGSTALLVELEDKVAQAAANVQSAQSQVSFIENRIAALNAAGMPAEGRRRSAIPVQARRLSHNFPTKAGHDAGLMRRRLSIM
ncbi:melanophilin isoform X1 [Fundulus heteroclitus]|uniref:melanophilin isoform X1 n=1 Tax=Fundulus heteroclitus TaxID=8078 RepID=UPI00165BAC77|nr:melanophilin isoform X1 [Fundulus heteroclitus]